MALQITITDAGRAEIINAQNTGTDPVVIAEIGLGTGQYVPAESQTALVAEFKRLDTFGGNVVAPDVISLAIRDDSADIYEVSEFGLYTASGTLFAVYSQTTGPFFDKAAQAILLLAVDVKLTTLDAAALTFGDINFVNPPATETTMGVVELATVAEGQAGTDTERAVTPAVMRADSTEAATASRVVRRDGSGNINVVGLTYSGALTGGTGVVNIGSGQFYKASGGNVGIGTATPGRKLHVSQDSSTSIAGVFQSANAQGVITFMGSGTSSDAHVRVGAEANDLVLFAGNAERARLTATNRVGFGTSTPTKNFEVVSGSATNIGVRSTSDSSYASFRLMDAGEGPTTDGAALHHMGPTYATGGAYFADGTTLSTFGSGGQNFFSTSDVFRFFGGGGNGTLRGTIDLAAVNFSSKEIRGDGFTNTGYTSNSTRIEARNQFRQNNAGDLALVTGWIAAAFGDELNNRVIIGQGLEGPIIGAHNAGLTAWAPLFVNPNANALARVIIGTFTDNGTDRLQVSGVASVSTEVKTPAAGSSSGNFILKAGGNEVARLTSGRFLKASNSGVYGSAAGLVDQGATNLHVLQSNVNIDTVAVINSNAGSSVRNLSSFLPDTSTGIHFRALLNAVEVFKVAAGGEISCPGIGSISGNFILKAAGNEVARLTSGRFLKASNSGVYGNAAGIGDLSATNNHVFQSNVNGTNLIALSSDVNSGVRNFVSALPLGSAGLHLNALLNNAQVFSVAANGAVSALSYAGAGTGLTGTAAGLSIGGNAGTVTNGVYTTGNQAIGGVKTFSSSPVVPTPAQFANDTNAASTAFVQRALGNYSDVRILTANTVLTADDAGKYIFINASSISVTLPDPATLPLGATFTIVQSVTTFGAQIVAPGGVTMNGVMTGSTSSPIVMQNKAEYEIVAVTGTAYQVAMFGGTASLVSSGYQFLPSGLILQWKNGASTTTGDQVQTITYPIAFPNAVLSLQVSTIGGSDALSDAWFQERTSGLSSCTVVSQWTGTGSISGGMTPRILAIGH